MKCCECHEYKTCRRKADLRRVRHRCSLAKAPPKPQTNADRIRAMSDEELAELLCSIAYARNTPWSEPFATKFCKSCPTVEATIKETGKTMGLKECDFVDGLCPHGSDAVWWLRQPVKEVSVE